MRSACSGQRFYFLSLFVVGAIPGFIRPREFWVGAVPIYIGQCVGMVWRMATHPVVGAHLWPIGLGVMTYYTAMLSVAGAVVGAALRWLVGRLGFW